MLQKSADARKKLPPLKPILTLQTWGKKCFISEAEPFEIPDFDLGHPVYYLLVFKPRNMGEIPIVSI